MNIHKILRKKKFLVLKTSGNSMLPILKNNDTLYLKKASLQRLHVNDIVCIKKNKQFITHRLIYKQNNFIVTRGDNNRLSDGVIKEKNIVGKVIKVKRNNVTFSIEDIYSYQSAIYLQEIIKLNHLFQEKKINFVFLKGLIYHFYYENSNPSRYYQDCDILIDQSKLKNVEKALEQMGYSYSSHGKTEKDKYSSGEISYAKIVNNIFVTFDIHFSVVFTSTTIGTINHFYSDTLAKILAASLLKNKKDITYLDHSFPILDDIDSIIYLSLHALNHNYRGIQRFSLLNTITKTIHPIPPALNKRFLDTVMKFKLSNFILPSLFLLQKYYPSDATVGMYNTLKNNNPVNKKVATFIYKKLPQKKYF